MITLEKKLQKDLNSGAVSVEELTEYLVNGFPVTAIARSLAELLVKPTEKVIPVNQDEYDRIVSMFRPRGIRMVDGEPIKETRGRKPVVWDGSY